MNREVEKNQLKYEFRVYDKLSKEYITFEEYQKLGGILVDEYGGLLLSGQYRFQINSMLMNDCFSVEMYAFISDSDTEEKLYEGDKIRYCEVYDEDNNEPFDDWQYGEIKWFGKEGYPALDITPNDTDCNLIAYMKACGYYVEKIGNIHDNPELTKEEGE